MQGLPKNTTPKGVEIFHQGSFVHPCIADTAVTIFASGKMVEYAFERNRNGCGMQMIPMKKNNTAVCVATSHSRCADIVKEYRFS